MCDSDEELEELEVDSDEVFIYYPSDYICDGDGSYIFDIERRAPLIKNLIVEPHEPVPSPDEWRALGRSIGNSNNLLKLHLSADDIGEDDDQVSTEILEAFCTGLSRNRSLKSLTIEQFKFSHARLKWEALHPLFNNNQNLIKVDLSGCNLNAFDIQGLANAIRQEGCCSPMKHMGLGDENIGDDSVPAIIDIYNACPRLKILDLSYSRIGNRGCTELASMLFRDTRLRVLSLNTNSLGDEGALALANAIVCNCTLTNLGLCDCSNITAGGWSDILETLCDTSSINGTYQSNHTIKRMQGMFLPYDKTLFGTYGMNLPKTCGVNFSEDLRFYLQANSATDKSISARKKIFRFHMSGAFDLSPFFNMDALVLPQVLGWIGKDYSGHGQDDVEPNRKRSTFYRILQNFPDLCGYPSRERKLRCRLEQRIKEGQMENEELKVEIANLKRKATSGEGENTKLKRRISQLMSENAELKSNNAS